MKPKDLCPCHSGRAAGTCCRLPSDGLPQDGPLVSVIIPTCDRPVLLARALESVLAQTYRNLECIVVNDAGADVQAVLAAYHPCISLSTTVHATRRGLPATRNTALDMARGEIIAYLDDDDRFLPDHLARLVQRLSQPGIRFAYTQAEYVKETVAGAGQAQAGTSAVERTRPYEGWRYSKEMLHVFNYIPVNTWGHWSSLLGEVGPFDTRLGSHEDWEFLLRCARRHGLSQIACVTVEVHQRIEADNMLRRERLNFADVFRRIYALHDDQGDPRIATARQAMLQRIEAGLI